MNWTYISEPSSCSRQAHRQTGGSVESWVTISKHRKEHSIEIVRVVNWTAPATIPEVGQFWKDRRNPEIFMRVTNDAARAIGDMGPNVFYSAEVANG